MTITAAGSAAAAGAAVLLHSPAADAVSAVAAEALSAGAEALLADAATAVITITITTDPAFTDPDSVCSASARGGTDLITAVTTAADLWEDFSLLSFCP